MKKFKGFAVLLGLFLLVGCNNSGSENDMSEKNTTENTVNQQDSSVQNQEEKSREKETTTSEIGELTIVNKQKDLNMTQQQGDVKITLKAAQVASLVPNDSNKALFEDKDKVTVVTLELEVENLSDETLSVYPDQGTIVTNTKEQKNADLVLSDELEGELIGKVVKKGNVIFLLDSEADQIEHIKYLIDAPHNESLDSIGDKYVFELDL